VGARVEGNDKKENPLDFALWKQTEVGIKWSSPFGEGRPGWHTECVVMINNHFGGKIDIHGGGLDLKFPHHENEIAQAKAAFNHDIANYWIYNGMLDINGEKMSKSLGNELLAQDIVDKFGVNKTRWILLGSHYRAQLQFSEELLEQAEKELHKIYQALKQGGLKLALSDYQSEDYEASNYQTFLDCLNDDLNTPNAYAVIFETVKEINQALRLSEVDLANVAKKVNAVKMMLAILGITIDNMVLSQEDRALYAEWQKAKVEKNWEAADHYRQELMGKGII
jgi:cysteinyl-tRNA synthetase